MSYNENIYLNQKLGYTPGLNRTMAETTFGTDFLQFVKREGSKEEYDMYFNKLNSIKSYGAK